MTSKQKLWGGRFHSTMKTDPLMEKYNASFAFDRRLWQEDLNGSMAYAKALHQVDLLTESERDSIVHGLESIAAEWSSGAFVAHTGDEDIHTAHERRLMELIGTEIGGKLHTGRSRNDQVATDLRLYVRRIGNNLLESLRILLQSMVTLAQGHDRVLMPGFTHLQPAQPVRFAHWLLSHAAAMLRDGERLEQLLHRANVLPLGSGALAGNAFGLNREFLAKELGFHSISLNSLDAVSDRDFVAEFMFWGSMFMLHVSQLSEDLIIYNTMKCVQLADAYCTGSSLMPQKKNPDALELLRGKTGRIIGRLTGFMVTLKGLPRSYNKDLQEDKEPLFDCMDTISDCIAIATGVISTMLPSPSVMTQMLVPEMLATDLAEYLVRKGVPFRETHHIAGAAVRLAEEKEIPLSNLSLETLQRLHPLFEADVFEIWNFEGSVERKSVPGGTSSSSIQWQVDQLYKWIKKKNASEME